jgi:hypothetical protein
LKRIIIAIIVSSVILIGLLVADFVTKEQAYTGVPVLIGLAWLCFVIGDHIRWRKVPTLRTTVGLLAGAIMFLVLAIRESGYYSEYREYAEAMIMLLLASTFWLLQPMILESQLRDTLEE